MSMQLTLQQAVAWITCARMLEQSCDVSVARVHTDTRTVESGDLFVALKGERFDANDFLQEAQQRGAVAALCHLGAARSVPGLPCIEVADTRVALGQLATAWRAQFAVPLIAVTGSNGKTTVTQMVAAILDAYCPNATSLATRGNLNNDIGVPLTLLRLRPEHTMAVVELGMNHPGEIATLSAMAQPTVALVNNAQREHLEFMHTLDAVAQENGSVIEALGATGVAVLPADDDFTSFWRKLAGVRRVATFSLGEAVSAVHLACVSARWESDAWAVHAVGMGAELRYRLSVAGQHNVKNSLAAAACALEAGVAPDAVARGLEAFVPVKGRSRALALQINQRNCTLVDDTYNANPDSVRAAIDVLAELPGPRLLVLGDMGEVGSQGPQFHAEAGHYAQESGIEHVLTLGVLARHAADNFLGARHFDTIDDLNPVACMALAAVNSVLVKGSRFMRMERVVDALLSHVQNTKETVHAA